MKLSPTASRFLTSFTAYFVTLAAGLTPLLGKNPIAQLFPANLQKGLVPFATFLMIIPVIAADFFSADKIRERTLNVLFGIVIPFLIVLPLLLYFFYAQYVVQVDFEGGRGSAAYVVGTTMLPSCACAKHQVDIEYCIGHFLSTDPAEVNNCYPRAEIVPRRATLALLYLLMMLSFAAIIALLVLKTKPRKKRQTATPPRPSARSTRS